MGFTLHRKSRSAIVQDLPPAAPTPRPFRRGGATAGGAGVPPPPRPSSGGPPVLPSEAYSAECAAAARAADAARRADDRRSLLGPSPLPAPAPDTNAMDEDTLVATLHREAATGVAAARGAATTAVEARAVAATTAATLGEQTAQLVRIAGGLDETETSVAVAERLVDELSKNKVRRAVERPFRSTAARLRVGENRRRGQAVDLVVAETRTTGVASLGDDLLSGRPVEVAPASVARGGGGDDVVDAALREQDAYLDKTAAAVADMKSLALAMSAEIHGQTQIIDNLDANRVREAIGRNARQLKKM
ncbi:hypothetical protein MMPV_001709 [Pyropia vietnamensis]